MELYTVDSIADGLAVLMLRRDETVRFIISREDIPGAREGDIISAEIVAGQVVRFQVESEETDTVRARLKAKLERIKNRPGL